MNEAKPTPRTDALLLRQKTDWNAQNWARVVPLPFALDQHTELAGLCVRLECENAELVGRLEWIVALSAGWDQLGSTGPRDPYSWESVGRMAMDIARAALAKVKS